jgi:hypothetical protein
MTVLTEPRSCKASRLCRFLLRSGPVLLLGGYLLFAHGCHGDEDNELFNRGPSFSREPPASAGAALAGGSRLNEP